MQIKGEQSAGGKEGKSRPVARRLSRYKSVSLAKERAVILKHCQRSPAGAWDGYLLLPLCLHLALFPRSACQFSLQSKENHHKAWLVVSTEGE